MGKSQRRPTLQKSKDRAPESAEDRDVKRVRPPGDGVTLAARELFPVVDGVAVFSGAIGGQWRQLSRCQIADHQAGSVEVDEDYLF